MSQSSFLLWKETYFFEAFFMMLGFIPIYHACAGKPRDRHNFPPHLHFLLLNGSWRWFITTQTDGAGERRKRKAFQAGRGISGRHISWSFHQSPSPASHLNPPLKHRASRQGLWHHQHPAQRQAQVGLQVLATRLRHTQLWGSQIGSTLKRWIIWYTNYISIKLVFEKEGGGGEGRKERREEKREGGRGGGKRKPDPQKLDGETTTINSSYSSI